MKKILIGLAAIATLGITVPTGVVHADPDVRQEFIDTCQNELRCWKLIGMSAACNIVKGC